MSIFPHKADKLSKTITLMAGLGQTVYDGNVLTLVDWGPPDFAFCITRVCVCVCVCVCVYSVTAFHCVVTEERFYICSAKPDVSLGICYNFLADVQEEDQKGFESGNAMLGALLVSDRSLPR